MKKHLLQFSLGLAILLVFGIQYSKAQDTGSSKVHITITQGDKVITDTSFQIDEGQDPELIKKVVASMAGGGMNVKHFEDAHDGSRVFVMKDDLHKKHHKMMMDESGKDCELHEEHTVIVHTHGKDCEGKEKKIEVIVVSDGDEVEWIEKGEGDENVEVLVIKEGDDDVKVVKKKVKVILEDEEESEEEIEVEVEVEVKKGKEKREKKKK